MLSIIQAAGWPIWPLLICSIAALTVVIERLMNLRGVRESGTFFAIPTYLFMAGILGMCAWGFIRLLAGTLPARRAARLDVLTAIASA